MDKKEVYAEFRSGKVVKFTTSVLDLLISDKDVIAVMDAQTGEMLYWESTT